MTQVARLLGPVEVRSLAAELDIHPAKRLGQNFVIDPNTVRRIVNLTGGAVNAGTSVLEVGPGLGSLTLALLDAGAFVHAVEIDARLAEHLPDTVSRHQPEAAERLRVVRADALTVTAEAVGEPAPTVLVANLPYNVGVPVLLHCLDTFPSLRRILVMVQKEVADRLVASPGSRTYGVPSVKVRWWGSAGLVGKVPPSVFWPRPRVDSGLVRIDIHRARIHRAPREEVFGLVDEAFSQRRKLFRSAVIRWMGSEARVDEILNLAGVDHGQRGENLTLEDFEAVVAARHRVT